MLRECCESVACMSAACCVLRVACCVLRVACCVLASNVMLSEKR